MRSIGINGKVFGAKPQDTDTPYEFNDPANTGAVRTVMGSYGEDIGRIGFVLNKIL